MKPAVTTLWWPEADDVLEVHRRVATREHRPPHIRADTSSLIGGAVSRVRNRVLYGEAMDDCLIAAHLAFDIANIQAFADINKRTAATMMTVFLRQRGWFLRIAGIDSVATFIVRSATEPDTQLLTEEFAAYLRSNVHRIGPYPERRVQSD